MQVKTILSLVEIVKICDRVQICIVKISQQMNVSDWSLLSVMSAAPVTAKPAPEGKSKGKAAVQSAPVPVNKAVVISLLQQTFAYLSRAAVRNEYLLSCMAILISCNKSLARLLISSFVLIWWLF